MTAPKRRGRPSVGQYNVRLSPAEFERLNEGWPEDMHGDRNGLDFTMPPPPWNDDQRQAMADNLARLRVDPKSTNFAAALYSHFAAALIDYPDDAAKRLIADDMARLLSENRAETIESFLGEIVRMAQWRDQQPHANFYALRAYYDFLESNGFNPTQRKLAEFIAGNPRAYPVGKIEKWWDLFFEAGLSRLAESRGI